MTPFTLHIATDTLSLWNIDCNCSKAPHQTGKQAVMWLRINTETETSADRIQESLTTIAESRNFPFHSRICRCHAEYFITEGEECTLEVYSVCTVDCMYSNELDFCCWNTFTGVLTYKLLFIFIFRTDWLMDVYSIDSSATSVQELHSSILYSLLIFMSCGVERWGAARIWSHWQFAAAASGIVAGLAIH